MADTKTSETKPAPRKRGSWLRVLLALFVLLIVLVVVVYFVATSSSFLQGQILPRVSKALNANVTVSSAEIHPFSLVVLHDLKVQPTNQPTLLTAQEARVKYSLMDIIGGNIHVEEMSIMSPVIQIVKDAHGHSNLDPLLEKKEGKTENEKAKSGKESKPPQVNIRKVTISNATISSVENHENGTRDLVELTNVEVVLTGVKNGEAGKLQFSAIMRDEDNPPAPAMYGLLQAKVDGSFNFSFTPDLKPNMVLGDAHLNISQAAGSFSDFAKLNGVLHCDLSPSEIKALSLNFEKDGVQLGELRASGPFDAQKSEGRLSVELVSVDKKVLNLLGAQSGFDFGSTTISLTNQVELTKGGEAISAVGELSASKFQLSRTNLSTPAIDLRANYNVSVDKTEEAALLRTLNVAGTQNGRTLLRGELTSPMTLAWGKQTNGVGDSAFSLAVSKLNLADWKIFLGDLVSAGILDLNLKVLSEQGGKRLTFDTTNQIQNLAADVGGEHFTQTTVTLNARGQATDLKQFNLNEYGLQVGKSNQPAALTISGSGTYDAASESADLQVGLKTTLARLLPLIGQSNLVASAGTAELKARVTQKEKTQTVNGTLTLTNFTGNIAGNELTDFGTAMALEVNLTPEQIEIRKAAGTLTENRKPGGSFEVSGNYGLKNAPSQLTVKLSELNENGLRPFLAPMLAGKKLVTVALNGTATAQRSANGDSAIKADLQVTNLVVNDPAHQVPATPLEARVLLDASLVKQIADVRQLQLTLTPTQRAKNQFQLQGRVDASRTNAIQGTLTLSSDSLDLTSYYDLFAGTNKTATAANKKTPTTTTAAAAPQPASTPVAATNQLPFKNFTVEANVKQFYLREIAATNLQTTVKVDGSRVVLKPLQLTLNGSPMRATADVDLSVPGYKYAVTFNATNVPFAPIWNTFNPEEKGQVGGTLSALVDISGVGTTGESLQKTLKGTFHIGTTNLNLDVAKIRSPVLRDIVAVVAKLPDLFDNPVSGAESLLSGMAGRTLGKPNGGLSEDVSRSPIDVITARGTAGDGRVTVESAVVRSTVFQAEVNNGSVTLAKELTNSPINFPVSISLSQSIAQRIPYLASNNTSTNSTGATNASYAKIPDFYVEKGTLGNPKPSINAASLGKGVLQKFIPGLGGGGTNSSGNLLQGVGNLLQGGSKTNQPGTNQPAGTNQSPVNNLLDRFLGPGTK
jgi:hypothetical protein